jgi:DNA primase
MDFVEQVKSSVDIVSVVGEYVRLRRQGSSGRYVGLCPFHSEKTPSFHVDGSKQAFYCFGCQKGGDVFSFVMQIEALTFFEALRSIAERQGIPMPRRAGYSDEETKLKSWLYQMHEIAARVFRNHLHSPAGAEARAYLERRGVRAETAEEFGLGLSERSGQSLVRRFEQEGIPPEVMEASGLVLKRQDGSGYYDRFRGRLMFPIHSESGKIIAFGGRALAAEDEPKYLNSPETPLYRKSYVLYNLNRAKTEIRKRDRVILVEGYMDVIGVYASGVKEVVASCGTALRETQVQALRRHSDKIVVNFDPDAAGESAAERSIQMLLDEGMHVRVLPLEGGLDPDEFIQKHGAEKYRQAADSATGYFFWLADRMRKRFGALTAEQRMESLKAMLPAIDRIPNRMERAAVTNEIAEFLRVDRGLVAQELKQRQGRREGAPKAPRMQIPPRERMLLAALLESEEARAETIPQLRGHPALEGFLTRKIFETLCGMEEPVTYSALAARLEERDRALLAAASFSEDGETEWLDLARQCMRSLWLTSLEAEKDRLREQIKAAERAGNMEEAMRCLQALKQLDRG